MTDQTNYLGGPRHAPQAQISSMGQDQVGGTSSILNAAGRARPRRGSMGSTSALPGLSGNGLLRRGNQAEILGSAGLGRRAPAGKSAGEEMSDADQPTQTVEGQPDGGTVHHRWNPDGSVTSSPVGSPNYFPDADAMQAGMSPAPLLGEPL